MSKHAIYLFHNLLKALCNNTVTVPYKKVFRYPT